MTIRSIESLTLDEIRFIARDQADAGEPCLHGFEVGTTKALHFEHCYHQRQLELQQQED